MYDRRYRRRILRSLRIELNGTLAEAQDVSSSGLCASFPRSARGGDLIDGRLWLGRTPLNFSAGVRWFQPNRMGIRFLRADHTLVDALTRAAAQHRG
jgi:hypothetical protein